MPTFKIILGKQKGDKTFPVSIQITHLRQKKYLNSGHYVGRAQVKPAGKDKFILKDEYVINACNNLIVEYRDKLTRTPNLNNLNVSQIKDVLLGGHSKEIDFIAYAHRFIKTQTTATGNNTKVVINRLIDFLGYGSININEINLALLNAFVEYLRRPHVINQFNKQKKSPALTETAIGNYIGKIKQIFNAAVNEYNHEDLNKIVITCDPFRRFKTPKASQPQKRNVKVDVIKQIRDSETKYKSVAFGRDIFLLSFYLVGINTADLYSATKLKDGRVSYYRAKTKSRKQEKSLVSIKVEPEAMELLEKYRDPTDAMVFNFHLKYKKSSSLTHAANRGLKLLCEEKGISENITTYYARHSWATIARNICKVSKDDIGFALNHSDGANKTTDLYIEEDFSIIDEANRKVLDTLI